MCRVVAIEEWNALAREEAVLGAPKMPTPAPDSGAGVRCIAAEVTAVQEGL